MLKHLIGSSLVAVTLILAAGCNNTIPEEDTSPVPPAVLDPSYGSGSGAGAGGNTFGGGAGYGNNGGAFDKSVGDWQNNANSIDSADQSGWVPADPSGNRLNMPIIYFAYDSDALVPSETANLDRIAQYLQNNSSLGLVIEGHCDQRGTEEYNRALGERRANAIRAYLANKGLADQRIRTLSFGKEKPAVQGSGESIWRQNRRGVPVPMRMPRY